MVTAASYCRMGRGLVVCCFIALVSNHYLSLLFDNTHLVQVMLVGTCSADCKWREKGITVKDGEVVGFSRVSKKVKICEENVLKYKLATGYKIACNGINIYNLKYYPH
jgi:hypothetical protein